MIFFWYDINCHTSCYILSPVNRRFFMAGEVTEAVKESVGCLFWMAVLSVALTIGYFILNIILYLIPVILAIAIGLAVLYGIGYVIYALFTGR